MKSGSLTDTSVEIEWQWVRGADLYGVRIREVEAPISDYYEHKGLLTKIIYSVPRSDFE